MELNAKIIKRSCLALMAITTLGATTAHAALAGRYNWGLHYSTMDGKHVISETDTTSSRYKTYAIANNDQPGNNGRRTGPWAYVNQASIARTVQTKHHNRTGYNYKYLGGKSSADTEGITVMHNLD